MQKYLIDKNSDNILIFFTGWGCDEYEFEHIKSNSDVLLLYNFTDLNLDFDFSKYKNIDLISFSAGVFVSSVMDFDFKINRKIAIAGTPYLFDEKFGISKEIQDILYNITEDNAEEFARNYLVKTDEEWENFYPSKRTLESCRIEFDCLKNLYTSKQQEIKNFYDFAVAGDDDPIFKISSQKEFYGEKLKLIKNSRHNIFFKINNYDQILNYNM